MTSHLKYSRLFKEKNMIKLFTSAYDISRVKNDAIYNTVFLLYVFLLIKMQKYSKPCVSSFYTPFL